MLRNLLILTILFILVPFHAGAAKKEEVLASFIRKNDLWLLQNNKEIQITKTKNVYSKPMWSHDGKWLLYQVMTPSEFETNKQQVELWAYEVESGEKKKLFYDAHAPSWSPVKNIVAFNASGILDISDFSRFYNIATGVHSYTWLPDGSGFLLSTSGVLRPDGWSSAILYTKKVSNNYKDVLLFGGVDHFFTLPKEIGTKKDNQLIAVYAEQFAYSPSKKWISFIVSPTASWSMDSNMLCVISSDGKQFEVLDEIVFEVGEPKWAPTSDTLAFIAGHGRIVFGFKNKDLKIREMPTAGTLTPEKYADLDFDWVNDSALVSSRIEEQEWNNDFKKHPLPSLYYIDINKNKQMKITDPPKKYGDYSPQYITKMNKIVWLRGTSILHENRDLWIADPDGSKAKEWIKDVEAIVFYEN